MAMEVEAKKIDHHDTPSPTPTIGYRGIEYPCVVVVKFLSVASSAEVAIDDYFGRRWKYPAHAHSSPFNINWI